MKTTEPNAHDAIAGALSLVGGTLTIASVLVAFKAGDFETAFILCLIASACNAGSSMARLPWGKDEEAPERPEKAPNRQPERS